MAHVQTTRYPHIVCRRLAETGYWLYLKLHQIVRESEAGQVFLSIKLEILSKVPLRFAVSGFFLIAGVPRNGVPWIAVCNVLVEVCRAFACEVPRR